jgi:hypothetical protein
MIDFKHSGFASDIIYSLPAVRKVCEMNNEKAVLHLVTNVDNVDKNKPGHPYSPFLLMEEEVKMLKSLLVKQDFIEDVVVFDGDDTKINVDLDLFRTQPINFSAGSVPRYYFSMTGITDSLEKPSLDVKANERYNNRIVISRSLIHQNKNVDWKVLNNFDVTYYFLGSVMEYKEIQTKLDKVVHVQPNSYLEAAEIIKGSSLFIGNHNLYYSIAESLKVKRMLEVCPYASNIVPQGGENFDIHYSGLMEFLVKEHLK